MMSSSERESLNIRIRMVEGQDIKVVITPSMLVRELKQLLTQVSLLLIM